MMSMLDVLKRFIKNLVTAKSRDLTLDFSNTEHSSPYSYAIPRQFVKSSIYYENKLITKNVAVNS